MNEGDIFYSKFDNEKHIMIRRISLYDEDELGNNLYELSNESGYIVYEYDFNIKQLYYNQRQIRDIKFGKILKK